MQFCLFWGLQQKKSWCHILKSVLKLGYIVQTQNHIFSLKINATAASKKIVFFLLLLCQVAIAFILRRQHIVQSRVSKSHVLTVLRPRKNSLTLRKILRFLFANKHLCVLTSFTVFSSYFTHITWFLVIFLLFFVS